MINKKDRFISLFMAVLMFLQMLPLQALAEEIFSEETTFFNVKGARGGGTVYHTVHFKDHNGDVFNTINNVLDGTRLDSIAPEAPTRNGYTFVQWTPPDTYITGDTSTEFTFTAQYRSTDLYELKIDYKYENGSPAALSYLATLAYGETYSVVSPAIQGFYIDPAVYETISGTAGTSQGGITVLNYTVTYKPSTGTPYTVEHYQQNIDNDEYTKVGTDTETLNATTGSIVTVNSNDYIGFTALTPTQDVTIAPDGSTVVKMYYDRLSYIITYDTAGGNFIAPFQARYGATIPAVANPTRTGYTFNGWSTAIPNTLTESKTIVAQWKPLNNINFTLVHWIENANPDPITNTYGYSYHSSTSSKGKAGDTYYIKQSDKINFEHFTYEKYDEGKTIAGDGSTVINIYYTRNSYTVAFNLNRNNATLTIGGFTYTHPQQYSFTAKYESDISDLWPTSQHIPTVTETDWWWPYNTHDYNFRGWRIGISGTTWTSKQTILTDELINPNGTRTFNARWEEKLVAFDLHYMFESLDGTGTYYDNRYYKQNVELSGVVNSVATAYWTAKAIPGMTNVALVEDDQTGSDGDYDVYFYYTRNEYILDFQSHGQIVPGKTKTLKYGESILPNCNFTPDTPADLQGYSFGGWYTTPDATPGTEFVWTGATMPAHNLRLFAKWVPPVHIVRFDYIKPDDTSVLHNSQQVIQGQKAVRPEEPAEILGYVFDGWYYAGTSTKYVFDSQVFSLTNLAGRYIPKNDRTYTVRYLRADNHNISVYPDKFVTDQTTGATVTEQAVSVESFIPDALTKSLTLGADNNIITFYYSSPNVDYTVRYLEKGTDKVLRTPVTKNSAGQSVVTEMALSIINEPYQMPDNSWVIVDFTPDMPQKSLRLSSNPDLNIITFYYEYVIKHHYEVRYLEKGTDAVLAEPRHVITAKSEVVELPKTIANYKSHSATSTYPDIVRSSSANYISTGLSVSDPVNNPPQVITFYYVPERIEIAGTKTWVDQGDPDQQPAFSNLSLTIYANNDELSPQPTPKWTDNNNDTWTYRYINLPAASNGAPLVYTVRETVPDNYVVNYTDKDDHGGTDITNTLDGGITTFSGTKTWADSKDPVSNFDPRPQALELTFYCKAHNGEAYPETWQLMVPQPAYTWNIPDSGNTWTYTTENLKKYENGYPVLYKAEETVPIGYTQTENNGQNFKNDVIYTTATKTWVDGPTERPTIWLRLYRQVDGSAQEPVPNAIWKTLESGYTEAVWRGLALTDENGKTYTYTVKEVDVQGNDFTPANYIKVENGLNVTNTYVIPTNGTATGTKTWVNGSATHPDLWLQLWRKIDINDPDVDEAVPNADVIKVEETENTSYEWTGLAITDINGNAYTFYIKEGQWDGSAFTEGTPENYSLSGKGTLNLTNTYVIPTNGTFTATKVWIDGEQVAKPDVWFKLQRRITGGDWEDVPGATPGTYAIKQVPINAPFEVEWTGLDETDSYAQPYEFRVIEGIYDGTTFTPGSPGPFVMTDSKPTGENTYEITNTYVSPKREDIIVQKKFAPNSNEFTAPVIPVTLELRRKAGTADYETVGNVALDGNIDTVEYDAWEAKFTDLDDTDNEGKPYTYKVRERDFHGNYIVTIGNIDNNTITVTNTWQVTSFTVKKEWYGGYDGMEHPSVQLQLWRRPEGMTDWEEVPVVGLITLPATTESEKLYTWENLPQKDKDGKAYEYSVSELTSLIGYTSSDPIIDNGICTIKNTYQPVEIKATKLFYWATSSTPDEPEHIWLQLERRTDDNSDWEVVENVQLNGEADILGSDGSGETDPDGYVDHPRQWPQWHYTWQYLPEINAEGNEYTYRVQEPTPPGTGWVRESQTIDLNDDKHWIITNVYRDDVFTAFKYWDTKAGTSPVTFKLWQQQVDNYGNTIPGTKVDMERNLVLDGIADDVNNEGYEGNVITTETGPIWSAVWVNLPTQENNNTVKYYVEEEEQSDPDFQDKYDTITHASTRIENKSKHVKISAKKIWVDGDDTLVRPNTTLTLKRYKEGNGGELVPDVSFTSITRTVNGDNITCDWGQQDRFYMEEDVQKAYVYDVEETIPENYELTKKEVSTSCDGMLFTLTNTYVPPRTNLRAEKKWDGGDESNRPAVTIRLWRRYQVESGQPHEWTHANPSAPGHRLDGIPDDEIDPVTRAREYEPWKMEGEVPLTDKQGNPYEYKITETEAVPGFEEIYDDENPFIVSNEYIIPKDVVTATKVFELGKNADKPDIWFQLQRKIKNSAEDFAPVPNADVKEVELINGVYTASWADIEQTDKNANPYEFAVVEGKKDGDTFTKDTVFGNFTYESGEGTLTLTNKYSSPTTATASATKTWVGGPLANQTDVNLTLYRKTATGIDEVVPTEDLGTQDKSGTAPEFTYTWTGLKNTDPQGNTYTYYVREPDVVDGKITVNGSSYLVSYKDDADGNSTTITNIYDPPADATFTASKAWSGGPNMNKTAVTLNLYRKSDNMTKSEQVTGVFPQITGEAPKYTYTWENLVSRDSNGDLYTFTVEEPGVNNDDHITINGSEYEVSYDVDKKDVTNTYQIPKDKTVTATKEWVNGPSSRPAIWFKLQRRIPGGAWEDVPGTTEGSYAEIKQVPSGLSVTWEGQESTDFNGNIWQYSVVEGKLEGDVFTEGTPENYTLSGQGSLNLKNTYTIPTDTVIAKKEWVNGPTVKPTVWFKLQRSVDGELPADIPSGEAGSAILKLSHGTSSVQWKNVEQTDSDGNFYTFSIVEGVIDEDTQEFTPGLPESYEYTPSAMEGSLGVLNTYTSPNASKTTKKIWAGGGPTPYPEIWLRLERAISPTASFEAVPNAAPTKVIMSEGSNVSETITWGNIALKNDEGVSYIFRAMEGKYNEDSEEFSYYTPHNYVSDAGKYDFGEGLSDITNTWQTFDLTAEIIWDGAPAEAYKLPPKTSILSLYRRHEGDDPTKNKLLGSITLDGKNFDVTTDYIERATANGWIVNVSVLPKNDPVTGDPFIYSVEQTGYPAIYTATSSMQNEYSDWVFKNTFDKTTVEVFKKYEQTTERPPVTIVLFQNGVEFTRFELNGIPHGSADDGEPYEKQAGLLILPNLPTRTMSGEEAKYTVTEIIPENYPYQRVITGNATDGFLITNTKNEGTFMAVKHWNIGQAPLPESVTFELWRWVGGSGHHYEEKMNGYDGVMDGLVDTASGAHGMEKRPWEYTWTNLPLNGNYNNDPNQPVYYTYFVKEVPISDDYIIDTTSSSSTLVKNIALKTDFTARKIWGGGPEQKPTVHFQLMRSSDTEAAKAIGSPVLLDGVVDSVPDGAAGELSPWKYTWTNLPRFENNDPAKPYTYTATEVNVPEGYTLYNNDSDRIINIHKSDVTATKTWVGGEAQRKEGIGPDTYFTLYRRTVFDEESDTIVVPAVDLNGQSATKAVPLIGSEDKPGTATVTWHNMSWGNSEGAHYIYSVVETDSTGNPKSLWKDADNPQTYIYNTTYDEENPLKVTNTYASPTYDLAANKYWYGADDGEILPDIWLRLWRGINDDTLALVEGADVKHIPGSTFAAGVSEQVSWTAVPKFDSMGREYIYTTREYAAANAKEHSVPAGFANTQTGLDQHNAKMTSITVNKSWKNLPEGSNGATVNLQLKQNGVNYNNAVPVSDNGTHNAVYTWNNLPTYIVDNNTGKAIACTYEVYEPIVPNGYTMEQVGNTITNTYDGVTNNYNPTDISNPQEPVTFTATKKWLSLPDGAKGATVHLQLKRNGDNLGDAVLLTDDDTHEVKYTWSNLLKYALDGSDYEYTVEEVSVPNGYTMVRVDNTVTNTYDGVTNNKNPVNPNKPQEPVTFTANSKWVNLPDGANGATVELQLKQNDIDYGAAVELVDDGTHEVNYIWSGLPKYAPDTTEFVYTVYVPKAPNGYTIEQEGSTIINRYDGVTNNENPADTNNPKEPVSIKITKLWQDTKGNAITDNSKLPSKLEIQLMGSDLSNHTHDMVPNSNGAWEYSFANLYKYDSLGREICYKLSETKPLGYSQVGKVGGNQKTSFILTNKYDGTDIDGKLLDITIKKLWQDEKGKTITEKLPAIVDVSLIGGKTELKANLSSQNDWKHTFKGLKGFDTDGKEFNFIVSEDTPNGYALTSNAKGADNVFTLINTYDGVTNNEQGSVKEPVELRIKKIWLDADGKLLAKNLPSSIEINVSYGQLKESFKLKATDGWIVTLKGMKKFGTDGLPIEYAVTEITPNGYKLIDNVENEENSFVLTNKYDGITNNKDPKNIDKPEEPLSFSATKVWKGVPKDITIPSEISLHLLANGVTLEERTLTLEGGWYADWNKLYKYHTDGNSIEYKLVEVDVHEDYKSKIEGDTKNGYTVTNTYVGDDSINGSSDTKADVDNDTLSSEIIFGSSVLLSIGDCVE